MKEPQMPRPKNIQKYPQLPKPLVLLAQDRTPVPKWLENFHPNSQFPTEDFFRSRLIYYPGCGDDGHPLRLWGQSHSAHCFVFSDYGIERAEIEEKLTNPNAPRHVLGYRTIHFADLRECEITPRGWTPHVSARPRNSFAKYPPFSVWAVLERLENFGEDHGPHRICIVHVCGDGFATYDAMFCQGYSSGVHGLLLQDHGFGGNWSHFGGDGYLFQLAAQYAKPKWLFVAKSTIVWAGYRKSSSSDIGGGNHDKRFLYTLQDEGEMMTALANVRKNRFNDW